MCLSVVLHLYVLNGGDKPRSGQHRVSRPQVPDVLAVAFLLLLNGTHEHDVEGNDHAHEYGGEESRVRHHGVNPRAYSIAPARVVISPTAIASFTASSTRPSSGPGSMPNSSMRSRPEMRRSAFSAGMFSSAWAARMWAA